MRTFLIFSLLLTILFFIAPGLLGTLVAAIVGLTISGLVALAIVGAVMLVVGLLFGSTLLALLAGSVALLVVGFSILWPLLLLFLVVWLVSRDKTQTA